MHNPESVMENETHKNLWDLEIKTDHLIPARRPNQEIINENQKRTCRIVDFTVSADHREKIKENEKWDKYNLARELKKIWNMKVTVIPIVISALGTIPKELVWELEQQEIEEQAGNI